MKSIILFVFFIAVFLIISGIYEQKLDAAKQNKQIEYRFIPRTYYEEQMGEGGEVSNKFSSIFNNESPWYDRTIGPIINIEKPYSNNSNMR